jgi:type VI secretion system protein ImpJ
MSVESARVIWSEGLFLRPHHFQQQERFFESLLESRLQQLVHAGFGFSRLVIDQALLLQGKLQLTAACGVMPDGTPFELPSDAAHLVAFDVPEGTRDATVYLAAMLRRGGAKSFTLEAAGQAPRRARYAGLDSRVQDNVAGFDAEAEVKLGVLTLSLGLQGSLDGAMTSLPVARIVERRANGDIVLDAKFVPPVLDVAAHPRTRGWLDELHGLVKQRGDALASRIGAPGTKGVAEFADFLLLLLCNRYEPLLAHLRSVVPLHPAALYAELLKLAGECSAFGQESRRPPAFPPYAHTALAETLEPVIEEIRRAMVAVLDQTAVQIPLKDLGRGLFGADIPDPRLIRSGYFVLAINARMPTEAIRGTMPGQVKIGPPEKIRDLVMALAPGVRIEPLPVAPRQLPYHAGFTYFQLDPKSEFWPAIETTRRLALYVAGDPPALELQMWAIRT